MDRDELIEAAERKQSRQAGFRRFYSAHYGLTPDLRNEECELILTGDPKTLTTKQIDLYIYYSLGFPPGYDLTKEQWGLVHEHLSGHLRDHGEVERGTDGVLS